MTENKYDWSNVFDDLQETCTEKTNDHYTVAAKIGAGGAKSIYSATDNFTGREVAFARPLKSDNASVDLFLREARITAYLQHPNILPIYDMSEEVEPYFVCKLLRGQNLSKAYKNKQTPLATLDLFKKICEAMDYAHSRGVLHLDLKPDNIQLDKYGELLIIDWGLAEIFLTESQESPLDNPLISTRESNSKNTTFCGTPGFMSPEQICSQTVDVRSDIFSLGALLYFMFFQKAPFNGKNLEEICSRTQLGEILDFDQNRMSSGLRSIMLKCLKPSKVDRYQRIQEILRDINALEQNFIPSAENANFLLHCQMFYRRNRQSCQLIAFACLTLVLLSVFYINELSESRNKALIAKQEALSAKDESQKQLKLVVEEQERNQKLSTALAPRYFNIANEAWHYFLLDLADEYCELALKMNAQYKPALDLKAKLFFVNGHHKKAHQLWAQSNSAELKLVEHVLNSQDKTDAIIHFTGNSRPIKNLKSRTLMKWYLKTQDIHFLKELIFIENPKLKSVNLTHHNKVLELQKNSKLISIDFIRALKPSSLNLRNTSVDSIASLKQSNFEYLNLSHCPLWDLSTLKEIQINKLDLSYSYIENLWNLVDCQIKELNINHTKIKHLPDQLMADIEFLSMNSTEITRLPTENTSRLKTLNLSNNTIDNLNTLTTYQALKTLIIDENQLSQKLQEQLLINGVNITQLSSSSKR